MSGVELNLANEINTEIAQLNDPVEDDNRKDLNLPSFWSLSGQRIRWCDPLFRKMVLNILLLSWSWSLGEGAFFIQVSTTTLAATSFGNFHLSTIPIGCMLLTGTIWSVFLPKLIARYGCRPPLYFGALMGMTGAGVCMIATWYKLYWLLVVGASFLGGQVPCTLYYRLLAVQFSTEEFAPKAIAMVVAGGCLSSVIGPEIAKHTVNALSKPYSGAYLTTLCECTLLLFAMRMIRFSDGEKGDYTPVGNSSSKVTNVKGTKIGRSLFEIARQRTFLIGALGGFVSWSAMAVQMSATPLAMSTAGYSFSQSTTAVEYHLLGMFVPSFFSGTLCNWFGSRLVMLIGLLTQLTGALLFQRGFRVSHFNLGLIIIGIGWNLGYVGASALLTQSHRPEEKSEAHSLYEAIVMTSITISFFSSAFALQFFGWMILTGRVIGIYLAMASLVLIIDTIFVFSKTRDIRKEIKINDIELESPT